MNGTLLAVLAVLLIGVGGAIGSVVRWAAGEYLPSLLVRFARPATEVEMRPWTTFLVNAAACFGSGLVVAALGSATGGGQVLYLALSLGVLGGLSTLAHAAADVIELVRRGTAAISLAYLMLTIGVSMGMLWLGLWVAS
ncbi:fluoride efflux transporter FluC [Brachybacterium sp. DNPG3]